MEGTMRKKVWGTLLMVFGTAALMAGCGKAGEAYEKGMELALESRYEESLAYFQDAIREGGDRAEYYIGYGMALNRLNRFGEAKEEFRRVLQDTDNQISKENNKQLYYGLAIAEYGLGEYEGAAAYCQKALKISYLDDMDCDIRYTRMLALCQQGEWEKAKEECQAIIGQDEDYYDAYLALARVERRLGNNDGAAKAYQKLISVEEMYYDAYFELYEQYCYSGQDAAAQELLNQILSLEHGKAENMLAIGRAYFYKGDYDKAEGYFRMSYEDSCKESMYYFGVLYAKQGDYGKAAEAFQTYIRENQDDLKPEAYEELATVYMEQKDYGKAQSVVEEGIARGNSRVLQGLKKTQVILQERQNNYQEALRLAREYRRMFPADEDMQKELAFIKTRIK